MRPASTARVTRPMISGRASSAPATPLAVALDRVVSYGHQHDGLQDQPVTDLADAGQRLLLGAVERLAVALVERAVVRVLAEGPQQRGCMAGITQHCLGVGEQQVVDLGLVAGVGVDVQDADLAVGHADDADDLALVLGQPRPSPGLTPFHSPMRSSSVGMWSSSTKPSYSRAPSAHLQRGDGMDVPRGDRTDQDRSVRRHGARVRR